MKRSYFALTFALGVLGFIACMNSENSATGSSGTDGGQLQLVAMKGLHKTSTSMRVTDTTRTYVFDLDTANSSIEQYFLLQNTGNYDVRHVTLTTNNPHFYFTPSHIDLVPPSKTSSIMQLVKLNVIHGTQLNGVGSADQLPMGINAATALVAGTTSNAHHDSIPISQTAQLKIYAKIFDVTFMTFDTLPLDMSWNNMNYGTYSGISGEALRGYYTGIHVSNTVRISNPSLKIVNSGNTSFKVTVYLNDAQSRAVAADSAEVSAGGSYTWPFPNPAGAPLIMIDGHGVVPKAEKNWLQPGANGATGGKFVGIFFPSA